MSEEVDDCGPARKLQKKKHTPPITVLSAVTCLPVKDWHDAKEDACWCDQDRGERTTQRHHHFRSSEKGDDPGQRTQGKAVERQLAQTLQCLELALKWVHGLTEGLTDTLFLRPSQP